MLFRIRVDIMCVCVWNMMRLMSRKQSVRRLAPVLYTHTHSHTVDITEPATSSPRYTKLSI